MAPNSEAKIGELLRKVDNDPHTAAELLAVAADYLKTREPLPDALADYLAHAFRRAASAPQPDDGKRIEDERISRLAEGLCLKRKEGRPRAKIPKGDVVCKVAAFGDTVSETRLKTDLAAAHGVSTGTALARVKETKAELIEAREKTRKIMESNELSAIVRPR